MPNYLLYHAVTAGDIHACAYSLLKHLDIYNLKPPPDQHLVIHTNKPALLEVYGSFFSQFELKELTTYNGNSSNITPLDLINTFCEQHDGNMLYLGSGAYPVRELEPLFEGIGKGRMYSNRLTGIKREEKDNGERLKVFGFNASLRQAVEQRWRQQQVEDIQPYIALYDEMKEFHLLLEAFFNRNGEESVPNQVKLLHHIDACTIQEQKERFLQQPVLVRLLSKLMGRGWSISHYIRKI